MAIYGDEYITRSSINGMNESTTEYMVPLSWGNMLRTYIAQYA